MTQRMITRQKAVFPLLLAVVGLIAAGCEQPVETVTEYKTIKEYNFCFGETKTIRVVDKTGQVDEQHLTRVLNQKINGGGDPINYIKNFNNDINNNCIFVIIIDDYDENEVIINGSIKKEGNTVFVASSWMQSEDNIVNAIGWVFIKIYEGQLLSRGKQSEFSSALT